MAKNDSTRAFTTNVKHKKKSYKSKKRMRQQIVISILAVIALILVVFATLIIGKIITHKKEHNPESPVSYYTIPCNAEDVKKGNLLLINSNYSYTLPTDLSGMINVYQYRKNSENQNSTQIDGIYTYAVTSNTITLTQDTLDAFNKMIMDYCSQPNFTSSNNNSVSNLEIAWGGYSDATRSEYEDDITTYGKDYFDHALGTTVTLKKNSPSTVITESNLKTEFKWIAENAHKYGFIVRYTDECQSHTNINSAKRIHLRYIGVEHATYIYENGCCLDKYLETLRKNHNHNNPLVINANGKTYEVYYVAYTGNPTNVPVPHDKVYNISGDNMNGFIVTVVK